MEKWKCDRCGATNEGEYWEPCKGCGRLRLYTDSKFHAQLIRLVRESPDELMRLEKSGERKYLDQQYKAIAAAQQRIGSTRRERLEWIISAAQQGRGTPEGLAGFERDIYFYGLLAGRIGYGTAGGLPAPKKDYGKRILERFRDTLGKVIARERIPLGVQKPYLEWFAGHAYNKPGYYLGTEYNDDLEVIVFGELCRQVQEYGHLIKRCPAPALRATKGEICGKWFLAKRPNQEYCSATCVSRKTTRNNPPKPKAKKRVKR